jgi:hypothetical protein
VAAEVVGVAGGHQGAQGEVGAVGDQAEAGEEAGGVAGARVPARDEEQEYEGEE